MTPTDPVFAEARSEVEARIAKLMSIQGTRTPTEFARALGEIVWEACGMGRNAAGLKKALEEIPALREEFWNDLLIPGDADDFNQSLETAGRVADFMELAELMCLDALDREESCGAHYREEYQTEEGEALRRDDLFTYVSAWEYTEDLSNPKLHKEPLEFENVPLSTRSYK